MEIRIHARNIEMNSQAERYIQKKFSRLERHLGAISDAKLEVSRTSARSQSDRVVAQMTLTVNRHTLRGQESGLNLSAAVDGVTAAMDRQIQRYKGRVYRTSQAKKSARASSAREGLLAAQSEESQSGESDLGEVVRTKRFRMEPMTVEDAILQMELLSHSFFMFYNSDTDRHNVVYRRQEGDYSVIEPE